MGRRRRSKSPTRYSASVEARVARFRWTKAAQRATDPKEQWVVVGIEQRPNDVSEFAFPHEDALELLKSLLRSLGRNVMPATEPAVDQASDAPTRSGPSSPPPRRRTAARRRLRNPDQLVSTQALSSIERRIWGMGLNAALDDLYEVEPALASHLENCLEWIFQQLRSASVQEDLVQTVHKDTALTIVLLIAALRNGYFNLWKDTHLGSRLAQIDPKLAGRPPKRKPGQGSGG